MFDACTVLNEHIKLHDRTAAGGRIVISVHFQLISIHIVNIRLLFPCVIHSRYGNELNRLPLKQEKIDLKNHIQDSSVSSDHDDIMQLSIKYNRYLL